MALEKLGTVNRVTMAFSQAINIYFNNILVYLFQ